MAVAGHVGTTVFDGTDRVETFRWTCSDKDVTQDILARMKSVEVTFPDLPVVTIREPAREEAKTETPGSGSSSGTQAGKRR